MSETAPSGFAAHVAAERAVMDAVTANQAAAAKAEAIEARRLTVNFEAPVLSVRELNDIAQIEIWGTGDKTAGFVAVPRTKEPLAAPIKGVVNEIRENRRYGTTTGEREVEAKKYEMQVQKLLGDDYELCQAKLIMDLRTEDDKSAAKMIAKYVAGGMSAADAEYKVIGTYLKKDAKRLDIIKREGIFTAGEYRATLNKKKPEATTRKMPSVESSEKQQNADVLKSLTEEANAARSTYARLSAGRGRRSLHIGRGFNKKKVAEARKRFERASRRLIVHEGNMALKAGVSHEDLDKYAEVSAIGDAERMISALQRERLLATGQYEYETTVVNNGKGRPVHARKRDERGEPLLKEVERKTRLGRTAGKFYKWWGKQADARFLSTATLKKSAVMTAAGVAVGAPAALAGTILLGPIAGGAVGALAANRIAKSVMANHIDKSALSNWYVHRLNTDVRIAARSGDAVGDVIDKQTRKEVRKNRRRLAGSIAAVAIGGTASSLGVEQLDKKNISLKKSVKYIQ